MKPPRERRTGQSDTGERRRESDQYEDFTLFRDKVLLGVGTIIVVGIGLAAIFANIHNSEVALGCLTVGGGLLGAPTLLRLDERAARKKTEE